MARLSRAGVVLVALLGPRLVGANCRGLDRTALIKLYEATDGASWTNNNNWNTSSGSSAQNKQNDPCDTDPTKRWYGVGFTDPCERFLDDIVGDPYDPSVQMLTEIRGAGQGCFAGRITALNLRRNGLKGNFTVPELGDLENLTYADLSWNEMGGAIPSELGRINNIQVIQLMHNSLVGSIPPELGDINSDGPAYSTGCGIDDPCPPGAQMKLIELNLGHNLLTGPIPSELGKLVHLTTFDVTNNNLTASTPTEAIPVELGQLTKLQVFYLRQNALTGSLPAGLFYNMTELRYVMFQENGLTGGVPSEVGRLGHLSDLNMHTNKLTEQLPDEIGDMVVAFDIRLQDNEITGTIPATIGKLTRLRHLDLYNNRMHGDVPAGIKNLTNLKELYLQNEHLQPVRQQYCRQRIPNVGKYSWRILQQEYSHWTSAFCDNPHDTEFTFNSLQHSQGVTS